MPTDSPRRSAPESAGGAVAETAPAKINLYLHVGPLRSDGLHDLDSLVAFADVGDVVIAAPAAGLSLTVDGPFAPALAPYPVEDNLVFAAARRLAEAGGVRTGAALRLVKNLPVAAGIGGGSADAAAALRALMRLWRLDVAPRQLRDIAFSLGADVPACLDRVPVFMRGAGERLERGPRLPPLWVCLVNPGCETPTGPVFRAFDAATPAPPTPAGPEGADLRAGYGAVVDFMAHCRNDLQHFAICRQTVIEDAIGVLAMSPGCIAARMSGSGATAFGLFTSGAAAERAAHRAHGRGWWAASGRIA
ncbi:MAG: 4-(cytidine 5'-diphospho)-2-C-methyl-D-erythritol kinase [Pseudomonadota bacterium]